MRLGAWFRRRRVPRPTNRSTRAPRRPGREPARVKPWLRRFAAVGLLVTAVDIGLLLLLARALDLPVVLADVVALVRGRDHVVRPATAADVRRRPVRPLGASAARLRGHRGRGRSRRRGRAAGLGECRRPSTTGWVSCGASCRPLSSPPPCASRPTARCCSRGPARPAMNECLGRRLRGTYDCR